MTIRTHCKRCDTTFTSDNRRPYHRDRDQSTQYDIYCKSCRKEVNREYTARRKRDRAPVTPVVAPGDGACRHTRKGFMKYWGKNMVLFRATWGKATLEEAWAAVGMAVMEAGEGDHWGRQSVARRAGCE